MRSVAAFLAVAVLAISGSSPAKAQASFHDDFFPSGPLRLSGRLYAPAASRYPVVVMVSGSGDESMIGAPYTRAVAEAFVQRGIGAFAYDKRGTGHSEGKFTGCDFETLGRDAAAAIRFAGHLPRVRSVGVWGISQAGWIIPYAVREERGTSFAILVSPAGVNPYEQMSFFLYEFVRGLGLTESEAKEAEAMHRVTLLYYASGKGYENAQATLDRYRGESWFHRVVTHPYWDDMASEGRLFTPQQLAARIAKRPGDFELARAKSSFLDYAKVYELLKLPTLVIYGSQDRLVPIDRSRAVIEPALRRRGAIPYEFKVFEGADHAIQTPDSRVRTDYLDLLAAWAEKHFAA